jgi:hypothetical protein
VLTCSWGRWPDIIKHAHFKHSLKESDVHMIARAIVSTLHVMMPYYMMHMSFVGERKNTMHVFFGSISALRPQTPMQ